MKTDISYDFSYYQLSLLSYLKDSYPLLASNVSFIKTRAEEAVQAYSVAISDGYIAPTAEEMANETLYRGLLFSKHDMLVNVLWNEFSDIIAQSEAKDFAIKIQEESEFVFSKYILTDEFDYSPEYDRLYTELTGFIDIWLEENEL